MKKMYFHKKITPIPFYGGKLGIVLTNNIGKLKETFPLFDRDFLYAHSLFTNIKDYQAFVIILNFNNKYKPISNGTITHEVIHIVNFIAEDRGFVPNFENDEPMAYLGEWIAGEVYKFIHKSKLKVSL